MAERTPNRWLILSLGLAAQMASVMFLYGLPMLVPALRHAHHLSLTAVGWVVAAPSLGLMLTLIAWGAAADRWGERDVMALGLASSGVLILAASAVSSIVPQAVLFGCAGAAGASVNAASGRVVMGWFAQHERGTAMGARQTAQPLGVGVAALVLPPVAAAAGIGWALTTTGGIAIAVALLVRVLVVDPPRTAASDAAPAPSPYRQSALWRVHASSALLVVPQFAVSAFALEFLVSARHWSPSGAGRLLFAFSLLGAAGRLAAGRWSDVVRSRLGPMRIVSAAAAVAMLALGLGAATSSVAVLVALAVAMVVTVADNGLGFTSVAELAGPTCSGRALGAQNTAQNLVASLTPPVVGTIVSGAGYGAGFAVTAVFPALALLTIPLAAETFDRA